MKKISFILVLVTILPTIQIHGTDQYFATAGAMIGRYEIPRDCAVQYQKSTTEKISLISHDHKLIGHVEIKYASNNGIIGQGYIPELEVAPSFQKGGIGSKLFTIAAHRLVNVIGVYRVSWDACPFKGNISLAKLIAFYIKNGGEVVSRIKGSANMQLGIDAFTALQKEAEFFPPLPEGSTLTSNIETNYEFWLCNLLARAPGKSTHYSFIAKKYPDHTDEWFREDGSFYSPLGREQQPYFEECMLECIANNKL